jgi:peptidoglycan-N-acetylglucosamine deacetylase
VRTFVAACALTLLCSAAAAAQPGRPLLVTVDDLPVAAGALHTEAADRDRITDGLLAVLAKHHVRAVGFVIWSRVSTPGDRAILKRWLAAGHELGNHTATHPDLSKTEAPAYIADVEAGRAGLAAFLAAHGGTLRFFRYPYLREGDTAAKLDAVRQALASSGQRPLPVTIDTQDWSFEKPWVEASAAGDADALARIGDDYQRALRTEVLAQTRLGDELVGRRVPQVLLLHANAVGAAQWDALFTWLESRGFRFASADEVTDDPAVNQVPNHVDRFGGSLWHRVAHQRESEQVRAAVTDLLQTQAAAWNRGDLEAFCAVYADDAVFLTPSGLTRGRQAVLDRYRTRYPTQEAMGDLSLEPMEVRDVWGPEVTILGGAVPSHIHGVSVVARWTLTRADGTSATGLTLLVFHRTADRWLIVQDASM